MSKTEIPFGFIEAGKIYLSSWGKHPVRQIGEVREDDPAASEDYFKERYNGLSQKLTELEKEIEESDNKGSYLMKLHHLETSLGTHCGLGDYVNLENRIRSLIDHINELVRQNQLRNTETKKELLDELEKAVLLVNWTESSDAVHAIKHKWIKTGKASPEETDSLEEKFWSLTADFFNRREAFYEDKKKLVLHYESNYMEIIAEAKSTMKNGGDRSKVAELKSRWRENGNIDQARYKELQAEFNRALRAGPPTRNTATLLESIREQVSVNRSNPSQLRQLLTKLKSIRPTHPSEKAIRRSLFESISKALEISFAESQCVRRFPDYETKPEAEKTRLKIQILSELLVRDSEELQMMESNSEQFNIRNSDVGKQMEQRLFRQKQKIANKENLIRELKQK